MLLQVFFPCFVDCGRCFCSAAAAAAAASAAAVFVSAAAAAAAVFVSAAAAAASFLFDYFVVERLSGWMRVVFEWELPPLCFYKFYQVRWYSFLVLYQVRWYSFLVWMVRKREMMLTRRMVISSSRCCFF